LDLTAQSVRLRKPVSTDGPQVTALIAGCPPLDVNSAYCNLLQCTDFADTCIIAEVDGTIAGWISGYRPPTDPDSYFLWQVAVAPTARGLRLSQRMMDALFARPALAGVTHLVTTITRDNAASWASFRSFARRWNAPVQSAERFNSERHFAGAHASEWQLRIGPLSRQHPSLARASPEHAAAL